MPASGVIRWGAIAFMLGGLVWIIFNVYFLSLGGTPARPGPGFVAFYVAAVLFTNAGLLGFHALHG
jgi:phosphoglycerol transferase MdoB-like AlkP superfamily enzyme